MIRILKIWIGDVRGVTTRTIDLTDLPSPEPEQLRGVTVVSGPNEIGKTSIVESLRALLDFPDTSRADAIRSLQTIGSVAGPQIGARLLIGGVLLDYTKRFLVDQFTRLEIIGPTPEVMTSRDAHDRVVKLLNDEVDLPMWNELQLLQSEPVVKVARKREGSLLASPSLNRELSQRTGTTAINELDLAARDRIREARDQLLTPVTDKRSGELMQVLKEVQSIDREIVELRNIQRELDGAIEAVIRLEGQLPDLHEEHDRLQAQVAELDVRYQQVQFLDMRCQKDQLQVDGRRQRLDNLNDEQLDRAETKQRSAELGLRRDVLDAELADIEWQSVAVVAQLNEGRARQQQLTEQRNTVRDTLRRLRAASERDLVVARLELVSAQLAEGEALHREIADLTSQLDAIQLPERCVDELEELDAHLRAADSALNAVLPRLEVEAHQPLELTHDGQPVAVLASGDRWVSEPSHAQTVLLGSVATIRMSAGDPQALVRDAAQARDALKARAAKLGVSGLAEARKLATHRDNLADRLRQRTRDQRPAANGVEHLRAEQARLRGELAELEELVSADGGGGPDPELGGIRELEAVEAQLDRELATLADTIRGSREPAVQTLRDRSVSRTAERQQLDAQLEHLARSLEQARTELSDADLAARLAEERAMLQTEQAAAAASAQALAEADPEALHVELAAATSNLERRRSELDATERQLSSYRGGIAMRQGDGLAEQIGELEQRRAHAVNRQTGLERQAAALRLLDEVLGLQIRRTSDQRSAPLRTELQSYGRALYGSEFDIELDESLRISRRKRTTVEGWLPYESLSVGAKEQLTVLVLLSLATLLADQGGVAIVDDALGNTDPNRASSLGAVFDAAGKHCQVLVLTCDPQRYANLQGARRITL